MLIPKQISEEPKFVELDYIYQDVTRVQGRAFRGVFGFRSIGKTHGILQHIVNDLLKEENQNAMCMLIRRKQTEITPKSMNAIATKLNAIFDTQDFTRQSRSIFYKDRLMFVFDCLNAYARIKYDNYDNPFVKHIFFDECFTFTPVEKEPFKLNSIIESVGRKVGSAYHDIDIWLSGNNTHGVSTVVDALDVILDNGKQIKFKGDGYVLLKSNIRNVHEEAPYSIKPHKYYDNKTPSFLFRYNGDKYGMYFAQGYKYIYFARYDGTDKPLNKDYELIKFLRTAVKYTPDFLDIPIYVDCQKSGNALAVTGIFQVKTIAD